ncbi:MAG: hypothetical protein IJG85_00665 [Eubacteriaceae bacterium]|nr:hypothetical protein [Eubacteriaceae bacterium]
MKRKLILATGLLIAMLLFAGCGAEQKTIGEKAEGEHIYQVNVTNDTEKVITKVQVKDNSMKDYSDNMLKKDETFAAGETRTMYVDSEAAKAAAKNNSKTKESYQIKVTFDDKSEKTLSDVPFSDMKACIIKWDKDNKVAYLTYESEKDGKSVSTKEAEIKRKKDAEKKAAEKKAAEKQAAEQKKTQESQAAQASNAGSGDAGTQQENSAAYDNSGTSYSEGTSGDYSGGAAQSADSGSSAPAAGGASSGQATASSGGCVNGGLMN